MVVGEIAEEVDFLVVGGGPGGYTAALRAAQAGRDVVLVDRDGQDGVGGVCLHRGCIPSKALIDVATTVSDARNREDAGIRTSGVAFDFAQFQEWKGQAVGKLTGGVRALLSNAGVRVLHGELRFMREGQAVVAPPDDASMATFVHYRDAVIATGSRPVELPTLPRDGDFVLDSTDALQLDELPSSVAIVGGGYIGVEIGTALAKLGARVVVVESMDRLLPAMDADVATPVRRRLEALGGEVVLGARVTGAGEGGLHLETEQGARSLEVAKVVVAVGRVPNIDGLGLENLGVDVGRGPLTVGADRRLTEHVAAIGDITPGPALAHKASAEAETAVDALCGRPAAFDPAAIPMVVFSDPEVAVAGLGEQEARDAGIAVRVGTHHLGASGRAVASGHTEGWLRIVADADSDVVVGVQIVAPHASELIGEAVLAIEMSASPYDLAAVIHPHPSLSETFAEAAHTLRGSPLHAMTRAGGRGGR